MFNKDIQNEPLEVLFLLHEIELLEIVPQVIKTMQGSLGTHEGIEYQKLQPWTTPSDFHISLDKIGSLFFLNISRNLSNYME